MPHTKIQLSFGDSLLLCGKSDAKRELVVAYRMLEMDAEGIAEKTEGREKIIFVAPVDDQFLVGSVALILSRMERRAISVVPQSIHASVTDMPYLRSFKSAGIF